MTATELKTAFLIEYDNIASNIAPPHEDAEISYFLSTAETEVVTGYAREYEKNELIRKKLSSLLVSDFDLSASGYSGAGDIQNSQYYEIPNEALKVVRERFIASSTISCLEGKQIKVSPVTQDEVDANYGVNPFKSPNRNKVWRLDTYDEDDEIRLHQIIYGSEYDPGQYGIVYLKYPKQINVSSNALEEPETHFSLHDEIVDVAVRMASAATRQANYQIASSEETRNMDLE